ncbi:integrase_H2C2 domain-containing protein [Trichonephila inaurata madagascariensis]|uniref:Integrase_H2C2 domain-containing protein n=1 Tax=Trichonephila inaurata madagascariensis TaxID=2747483 RepID=A0A8X6XIB5_9ARAC|nr:integrase_H2C2 domain-containing protein [Trichonephila inaurata madagascariensis]
MPSKCWPFDNICYDINEIEAERRKTKLSSVNLSEKTASWCASRFSDYDKIINVVFFAWTLRFINNCKKNSVSKSSKLSLSEIENAETVLMRLVQNQYFADQNSISSIDIFRDDVGILRVRHL